MTAHHVLLAQNKIGVLTGGRSSRFCSLEEQEQEAQKEEAFARATEALTRAQRFCFLMCPLDMKGLLGAVTVVGCLQHGAAICEQIKDKTPLRIGVRAMDITMNTSDKDFPQLFRSSAKSKNAAALVEVYMDR